MFQVATLTSTLWSSECNLAGEIFCYKLCVLEAVIYFIWKVYCTETMHILFPTYKLLLVAQTAADLHQCGNNRCFSSLQFVSLIGLINGWSRHKYRYAILSWLTVGVEIMRPVPWWLRFKKAAPCICMALWMWQNVICAFIFLSLCIHFNLESTYIYICICPLLCFYDGW